jgi:glycosyltransferase involved in cell wall biosynthesis
MKSTDALQSPLSSTSILNADSGPLPCLLGKQPSLGILIRFSNSSKTLPKVLAALSRQTLQAEVLLGVDSGGDDGSCKLIREAGGEVIRWDDPYEHSRVLNFGLRHLRTDLVLVLSSHTVLNDPHTLQRMVAAMSDRNVACVSGKWDPDAFYSNHIDFEELRNKGLKFGSIYSNSMGMIRRSLWQQHPFDECVQTAEDYDWAVAQLQRGSSCRRLDFPFDYCRNGNNRTGDFARITFRIARKYGLPVTWLGARATLLLWLKDFWQQSDSASPHGAKLAAWAKSALGLA